MDRLRAPLRRIVTEIAIRHSKYLFPIVPLASFWNHQAIREQVVHDRQAGRSLIADPTDLNRRRLAGEHQQPVVGRVACEVEQDVDPVRSDLVCEPFVAHADHIAPLGCSGLKAMSQGVFDNSV